MPIYEVRPGFEHGGLGQYKAGARVEMTEIEARGFLDKLRFVEETGSGKKDEPPPVDNPAPPAFAVDTATIAEVLAAVSDGVITAQAAYDAEQAGRQRRTLLAALEDLLNGAHNA